MKNFLLLTVLAVISVSAVAQGDKPASPKMTTENALVKVTYGAPYKKGRDIFGGLVPFGQVWRTGANEATEIVVKKDVSFGGKPLKAGTYILFTIPTKTDWTVIINGQLGQWGAYDYDKSKAKNVLEVKVPSSSANTSLEQFTITAKDAGLELAWDKTVVLIPIK